MSKSRTSDFRNCQTLLFVAFSVQKLRYKILSVSTQTPKNPDQWLELTCTIRNAEMINNAFSTAQVVRVNLMHRVSCDFMS
jgi:hypothetical protein